MGETYTGTDRGSGLLAVTEQDGTPYVPNVNKIKVSNTTLTDDGGGTVSVSTGGGGGAGVTTIAFGSTGLTPAAATAGVVAVAGTLVVANGGTGATSLTDHGILLGSGTAAITATAVPANGQLLIGSSGADPVLATLTSSGSTIGVTGGAGTLDIDLNNTTVPAGSYGSATHVGAFTVDAQGRLTAAVDVAIAGGGGAPTDAQYVVLTADPTLTDERILTAGDGIDITDGGAGAAVTVDADVKANSGIVIDTAELSLDLGAGSITGTLALADGGTGDTTASGARTNLDIVSGQSTDIITGGGGVLTSITVADAAVAAANTILFSLEVDDPQVISTRPPLIGSRNAGVSFTLLVDFLNTDPNPPGPGDHNVITNYMIVG